MLWILIVLVWLAVAITLTGSARSKRHYYHPTRDRFDDTH